MCKKLLLSILSGTAIIFSSSASMPMDNNPPLSEDFVILASKTPASRSSKSEIKLTAAFLEELNKITPLDEEKHNSYANPILIDKHLCLSGICDTSMKQLWPNLLKLSWLEELDLANNNLTLIPHEITQFPYLRVLNLGGNQLKTFSFISEKNMALGMINIEKNQLEKVEIQIASPAFTVLNLQDNKITSIILKAASLQELNIRGNSFNAIQSALFKALPNLTHLDMSKTYIKQIPEEIGLLTKLKELDISHNMLTTLPKNMAKLTSLHKLHAQRNHIEEFPAELCLAAPLDYLDLSFNDIKTLPEEFISLQKLSYLNLKKNKLREIPMIIGGLKQLASLNFEETSIIEVPDLSCLASLETLNLNGTSINSIPSTLGRSKVKIYYADTPLFTKETRAYDKDDDTGDESLFDEEDEEFELTVPFNSDTEEDLFSQEEYEG